MPTPQPDPHEPDPHQPAPPGAHLTAYKAHRRDTWLGLAALLLTAVALSAGVVARYRLHLPGAAFLAWSVGISGVIGAVVSTLASLAYASRQAAALDRLTVQVLDAERERDIAELARDFADQRALDSGSRRRGDG